MSPATTKAGVSQSRKSGIQTHQLGNAVPQPETDLLSVAVVWAWLSLRTWPDNPVSFQERLSLATPEAIKGQRPAEFLLLHIKSKLQDSVRGTTCVHAYLTVFPLNAVSFSLLHQSAQLINKAQLNVDCTWLVTTLGKNTIKSQRGYITAADHSKNWKAHPFIVQHAKKQHNPLGVVFISLVKPSILFHILWVLRKEAGCQHN